MRNRWTMNLSVFVLSILWYGQSGNDPHEDLAKFSYKIKIENIFLYFWLHTWTKYRNLAIFLEFCLNFGYCKSPKALDFGTSNFEYNFFAIYSQWQKRAGSDTTPPLAAVKCLKNTPDVNYFYFRSFFYTQIYVDFDEVCQVQWSIADQGWGLQERTVSLSSAELGWSNKQCGAPKSW